MANIFRRQPSGRIASRDLVRDRTTDASQLIAMQVFEAGGGAPQTISAGAPLLALTAPASVRFATRTLIMLTVALTLTAPAATVQTSGGPQILTTGAPVLTVTAPAATRIATISRVAGTPTWTLTAPAATRSLSLVTLPAGTPTLTVIVPTAVLMASGPAQSTIIIAVHGAFGFGMPVA